MAPARCPPRGQEPYGGEKMAKTKKRPGYQRKQVPVFNGCPPLTRRDLFDILLDTVTGSHGILLLFIYVVMCAYSGPYRQYSANNGMHDPAGPRLYRAQQRAGARAKPPDAAPQASLLTSHQPPCGSRRRGSRAFWAGHMCISCTGLLYRHLRAAAGAPGRAGPADVSPGLPGASFQDTRPGIVLR